MRLVTFARGGRPRVGALVDDERSTFVLDLAHAAPELPADMVALLAAGPAAMDRARAAVAAAPGQSSEPGAAGSGALLPVASVTLLAPVPRPGKILCVGYNYRGHDAAGATRTPEFPEIFAKTATTVVGPGAPIVLPRLSRQVDYEAELAVVVGRGGRDLAEEDALDHVAGYSIFNDVSARDVQDRGTQWLLAKSFDTFGPLGPALVTPDEVGDPQRIDLELAVNGVVTQRASTRDMIFTVAYLIAYVSQVMTLEPGDVISTGTPAKLPAAAAAARFLRDGDRVDITIGGLGTLSNPVRSAGGHRDGS